MTNGFPGDGRPTPNRGAAGPITLPDCMRPSEYTAAVLRVIEQRAGTRTIHRAIEIGIGSGVLLAALSRHGAKELWGVDIDPEALLTAQALLAREAAGKPTHLLLGDVWQEVPPLAFDVIVANLPHFPAQLPPSPGRNANWSGGGRDVLDAFLGGIALHLSLDGVAWMTHHALADLDRSEQILGAQGLTVEKVFSWTVYEHEARIAAVPIGIIAEGERATLRRIGDYHFVDAHVTEIRHSLPPFSSACRTIRRECVK